MRQEWILITSTKRKNDKVVVEKSKKILVKENKSGQKALLRSSLLHLLWVSLVHPQEYPNIAHLNSH